MFSSLLLLVGRAARPAAALPAAPTAPIRPAAALPAAPPAPASATRPGSGPLRRGRWLNPSRAAPRPPRPLVYKTLDRRSFGKNSTKITKEFEQAQIFFTKIVHFQTFLSTTFFDCSAHKKYKNTKMSAQKNAKPEENPYKTVTKKSHPVWLYIILI